MLRESYSSRSCCLFAVGVVVLVTSKSGNWSVNFSIDKQHDARMILG